MSNEATISSSVFNLSKNMIGAGLLSLPYTLRQAAWAPGIAALIVMAVLNGLSLIVIAQCCVLANSYSYLEIGEATFGRYAAVAIQVTVILYTLGSCVSYVVLIGDFLPAVLAYTDVSTWFFRRTAVVIAVAVVMLLPLSLLKSKSPARALPRDAPPPGDIASDYDFSGTVCLAPPWAVVDALLSCGRLQ